MFLLLYKTGIMIVNPWNPKARLWLRGRKNILKKLGTAMNERPSGETIWMHCASLGEFEQGRPVLENVKSHYPNACIVLTFFSSSGYEIRKKYNGADYIFYLPLDSSRNAKQFLDIVQPRLVLWVKYEYWYYYLIEIKKRKITLLLISGIFRNDQLFFKWYGKIYRKMLHCFSHIFVQTEKSKKLMNSIGFSDNVTISGDTRFDRVIEIAEQFEPITMIKKFCGDYQVIVAGSTWVEDEEELDHFANIHPEIRFIIAPHEIGRSHLQNVKKLFLHSIFYSEFEKQFEERKGLQVFSNEGIDYHSPANVLIIDNIGMLSRLYKYATITYVGGGFGDSGVHNVLEAAVYGKPVVFGPVYEKFIEAEELLDCGGAFSIDNALILEETFNILLHSAHEHRKACEASRNYVYSKQGAKNIITEHIIDQNLLKGLDY